VQRGKRQIGEKDPDDKSMRHLASDQVSTVANDGVMRTYSSCRFSP